MPNPELKPTVENSLKRMPYLLLLLNGLVVYKNNFTDEYVELLTKELAELNSLIDKMLSTNLNFPAEKIFKPTHFAEFERTYGKVSYEPTDTSQPF